MNDAERDLLAHHAAVRSEARAEACDTIHIVSWLRFAALIPDLIFRSIVLGNMDWFERMVLIVEFICIWFEGLSPILTSGDTIYERFRFVSYVRAARFATEMILAVGGQIILDGVRMVSGLVLIWWMFAQDAVICRFAVADTLGLLSVPDRAMTVALPQITGVPAAVGAVVMLSSTLVGLGRVTDYPKSALFLSVAETVAWLAAFALGYLSVNWTLFALAFTNHAAQFAAEAILRVRSQKIITGVLD